MTTSIDTQDDFLEQVSALADGELGGAEFAAAIARMEGDSDAVSAWNAYHVVGDVLRSGGQGARGADAAFVQRVRARLAEEIAPRPAPPVAPAANPLPARAANEPAWRWKMAAGFASVAAVVAVGWNVASLQARSGAQLAQATPAPTVVAARPVQLADGEPRQVMLRDPRLDELMAAHKQAGGASALQMPSGFLRNATFEGPSR